MEQETKFENLCSHYKDTYEIHRDVIKQRDRLFYVLLLIIGLFFIQSSSANIVAATVKEYVNKSTGVQIGNDIGLISTLLWLALLGFSTRYFQVVVQIERQYDYLHSLEKDLNSFYASSVAFTREGESYLKQYPLFSNWVSLLYTMLFPAIIFVSIIMQIIGEITTKNPNWLIDLICCVIISISIILYLIMLHDCEPKWLHCVRAYFKDL